MRKSCRIGALLVGTALTTAVLAGCDDNQKSPEPTPPKAQAKIFPSLRVCVEEAEDMEDIDDCKTAFSEAEKEHAKSAPSHPTAASCESVYGQGNCVPRSSLSGAAPVSHGSSDPFVPMMVGFMLGHSLDGGTRVVHHYPVYRDSGGYTYAGRDRLSVPPMSDSDRRDRVITSGSTYSGSPSSSAWGTVSRAESKTQATAYKAQATSYKAAVTTRGGFGSTGARAAVSSGS